MSKNPITAREVEIGALHTVDLSENHDNIN